MRMKFPVIQLSNFAESETVRLAAIIWKLKGECLNIEIFDSKCTHLVCERISCSEKFLTGCARGVWILTPEFIYDSAKKGSWVHEHKYEWTPQLAEPRDLCQIQICRAPSRWRQAIKQIKGHAFSHWRVAILVKSDKKRTIYQRLLSYGGAVLYMLKLPVKNIPKIAETITHVFVDSSSWKHTWPLKKCGVQCLHATYIRDYLIDDSTPDVSKYKLCKSWKRKISVRLKRKVPLHSAMESALASHKYFRLYQDTNDWQPVHWTNELLVNGKQHTMSSNESFASMHYTLTALINCYLEERLSNSMGLTMTLDFLSSKSYLPPDICYFLMRDILLKNISSNLNHMCYEILMKHLSVFPLGKSRQQLYLDTLHCGKKHGHYENIWQFIQEVITSSLQVSVADPDYLSNGSLLVFKFLVAVLEQDFSETSKSQKHDGNLEGSKSSRSLLNCIMWGSSYCQSINKSCMELKSFLSKIMVADFPDIYRKEVLSLLLSLVSMVTEDLRQACSPSGSVKDYLNISQLGTELNIYLHEVSKEIYSGCQEDLCKFDLVLSGFSLPWLALTVSYILTKSFHDMLELPIIQLEDNCSLSGLVRRYLSVLCQVGCQDTENCDSMSPRKELHTTSSKDPVMWKGAVTSTTLKLRDRSNRPVQKCILSKRLIQNVNKRNYKGETPLHTACIKNKVDEVHELLKVPGINVNARDNNDWTPLHEACNLGFPECVYELIKYQPIKNIHTCFSPDNGEPRCELVDVYAVAEDLIMPLHDAVINESVDCARLLLDFKGPKLLQFKTSSGYTPFDLANSDEMKELLNAYLEDESSSVDNSSPSSDARLTLFGSLDSDPVLQLTYKQIEKYSCFVFHLIRCHLIFSQLPYITSLAKEKQLRPDYPSFADSRMTSPMSNQSSGDISVMMDTSSDSRVQVLTECSDMIIKDISTMYNAYKLEMKLRDTLQDLPQHLKRLFLLFDVIE